VITNSSLNNFQDIPLIHLEDVYLTGLCAEACKISRKHHSGFKPRGLDKKKIKLWVKATDLGFRLKNIAQMAKK
jgi:hypothetical protein